MITPDSYIKLVRFDVSKEHQITFSSLQAQLDYFNNLSGLELQASTYQRKDYKIRFPAVIDSIEQYNYLIYRNDSDSTPNYYQDKTFFCYITDMEYVNDNNTDVTIKLDVFQTYQFDFIYKQSFVEREHANTDVAGDNIVYEGLEKGDFIENANDEFDKFEKLVYMVQVSKKVDNTIHYGTNLNGIYGTGAFYVIEKFSVLSDFIRDYTTGSQGEEAILNIYIIPLALTQWYENIDYNPNSYNLIDNQNSPNLLYKFIQKPSSIDGYTPKNKKLLTGEFNYLVVSNNNGMEGTFKYEFFNSNVCEFLIKGIPVCRYINSNNSSILWKRI